MTARTLLLSLAFALFGCPPDDDDEFKAPCEDHSGPAPRPCECWNEECIGKADPS